MVDESVVDELLCDVGPSIVEERKDGPGASFDSWTKVRYGSGG